MFAFNKSSKPNSSELESNTIRFEKSPYDLLFTHMEINGEKVKDLKLLEELLKQNKLIGVYLFHQIQSAHRYADTGRKRGTVVLKVNV